MAQLRPRLSTADLQARAERLNVSGSPAHHDDAQAFGREQELMQHGRDQRLVGQVGGEAGLLVATKPYT